MGEDPDRIRREIEQTRLEMGDTVDALTYKADVKSRAKESLMGTKDSIKSKVVGAGDAAPDGEQVKDGARRAAGVAQEAAESARDTVQEKGREHGEELASSAQQNMQQAASNAG